ncbi:MAG TPA: DUF4157 domain-containing protein [Longimicrobium sp.]|nr:DUF4157 domain-containing protein [Longimicrobium sp.]
MSARAGEAVPTGRRRDEAGAEALKRRAAEPAPDAGASPGVPRFLGGGGAAAALEAPPFTPTGLSIQRAPVDGGAATLDPPAPAAHAGIGPEAAPDAAADPAQAQAPAPVPGMIVDDAAEPGPGQMRKSDFLALLRGEVCRSAEEALAGTLFSTAGCPYVDRWVQHYAAQDAAAVEAALFRHVPEARGAAGARDYVPLVAARVRSAVGQWTGQEGAETAPPDAGGGFISRFVGLFFKGRDGGDGTAEASPQVVRARLGRGASLESGVASRMGSALGRDFSGVRVHTDGRAASLSGGMRARAFTVGRHVAFGPGEYRPGTPAGDALIAHELAHVAQQEGASAAASSAPAAGGALEEQADRSAVGAVARLWGGAGDAGAGGLAALRTGLRLQRCSSCREPSLQERLRAISDPTDLVAAFDGVPVEQLRELRGQSAEGTLLRTGLDWELAVRARTWRDVARLHRADARFHPAYGDRVVDAIMAGQTGITVAAADPAFHDWARHQLRELTHGPMGFRLIVDLLATGQAVDIAGTTGAQTTDRVYDENSMDAGRMVTSQDGRPLPPAEQRAGQATGSRIRFNTALIENQVVLGGTTARPEIIGADETVTFGHELIHALHNARGQNLDQGPMGQLRGALQPGWGRVRDPIGLPVSAEETFTITGQTRYEAPREFTGTPDWALQYNIPAGDIISENDLRAERSLPARLSHLGGTRAYHVPVPAGETLDQMLGRYSMADGRPVPPALLAAVRSTFLAFNPYFADHASAPMEITLDFPHGEYLLVQLRGVQGQADLADQAAQLRVRGAR